MSNRNDQHTSNRATRPRRVRRPARAERGTVLLMVVGVLALLAIIAVVYATLGRSDRASTAAFVRQQRLDDQAEDIANYLAQVIADGVFSTYVERDEGGNPFLQRSGADIPWTDEHVLSVDILSAPGVLANAGLPGLPANGPAGSVRINELFLPTGASRVAIADPNVADTREHGASFLASLGPVWLSNVTGNFDQPADEPLRRRRDWLHISNFAPSGNFVNLANLRNNFRAESGFGNDANNLPRLSSGLTLFNPANGRNFLTANAERIAYTSTGQSRLPHPAIPADWTNNQVWSFRPMVDTENAPQDHKYLFNQWADTDGDGFADARWFELVDISRAWTGNGQPKSIIPANGRLRLFVAARCIDASGLINLTTATDFARHPGQVRSFVPANTAPLTEQFARDSFYLPGASPADIDLRRVLTMADWSYEYGQDYGGGMSGFTRPRYNADTSNLDVRDYTGMTELPAAQLGASGYLFLQRSLARDAIMLSPDYTLFGRALIQPFDGTAQASQYGRIAREDEVVLPAGSPLLVPSRLMADFGDSSITPLSPDLRYLSYLHYGYRPQGSTARADTRLFFGGLGLADELELRTYQGVNDPDNTSRLEAALGARSPAAGNYRSPFRDDRPLGLEMAGRTMEVGQLFGSGNPNDTTAFARQVMATLFGDVRSRVTTISGARPIIDGPEDLTLQQDLTPDLMTLRLGAGTNPQQRRNKDLAIENVVDFYFDCLLPFRSVNGRDYSSLWKAPNAFPAAKGLAYGERAEIAFRCSLHLAVNLIDALDEDGTRQFTSGLARDDMQPTAISVEIAPNARGGISTSTLGGDDKNFYPWISTSRTTDYTADHPFRPTVDELRPTNPSDVVGSRVVNVFGVEPQPFLIEYGAFFIYTDAPGSLSGATDEDPPEEIIAVPPGSGPSTWRYSEVSIGTRPGMDRADFIGEVLFFQLTNPFDDEVTLFDGSNSDAQAKPVYYAKFANRCFAFYKQAYNSYDLDTTSGGNGTIRLKPGETRTFYAINPGTQKQLEERIRRVYDARPPANPSHMPIMSDGFMDQWFDEQFGPDAIQIPMVYPETFEPVGKVVGGGSASTTYLGEYIDLFGEGTLSPGTTGSYTPPADAKPGQRKAAELWRVMRASSSPDANFAGGDINPTDDNDPTNDLLADRLRDPGTTSDGALFELRDPGDVEIDSTQAGVETSSVMESSPEDGMDVRDNTGFTMILWTSIRRPTDAVTNPDSGYIVNDATLGINRPVRGVLPPWCIETKSDSAYDPRTGSAASPGNWSLNKEFPITARDYNSEGDFPGYTALSDLDPSANPPSEDRFRTIAQMVASRRAINPEIKKSAYLKDENSIVRSISKRYDGARKRYIDVAPEFHFVGQDDKAGTLTFPINATTNAALPFTSRNGMLFSRIGDMLLPLAVGPWSDPVGASGSGTWTIVPSSPAPNGWASDPTTISHEYGWTTLGESLALAIGYYSPNSGPGSTVGNDPNNLYHDFGIDDPNPTSGPVKVAKTERGCLRLDKFTPYRFNGGAIIEPIGLGIPFALNVISLGRVEYGVGTTLYGNNITGLTRGAAFGGLDKAVPGVINLNTTTVENARSLPLVSPIPELAAFNPNFAPSWATQKMDLTYAPGSNTITVPSGRLFDQTTRPDDVFDLATTLIAYRDKMTLDTRPKDATTPTARVAVSFADSTERSGRSMAAGLIPANTFPPLLREARGFKSIGEVLAANLKDPTGSNTIDQRNQSMTRLGEPLLDGSTLPPNAPPLIEQPGLVASRYYNRQANGELTPPVGTIQPLFHSDLHDSYSGKIAIANALAGTASVRSDVFICWFVVHGYLPEDTQVEDNVPMVPTVAKRFVMVVDRSNVTSSGQQPRVLMFKEVPMTGN